MEAQIFDFQAEPAAKFIKLIITEIFLDAIR
jgi:hypothetical protein